MDNHNSSRPARALLQRRYRRDRGIDHPAHTQDQREGYHMKHRIRPGDDGTVTMGRPTRASAQTSNIHYVQSWLASTRGSHPNTTVASKANHLDMYHEKPGRDDGHRTRRNPSSRRQETRRPEDISHEDQDESIPVTSTRRPHEHQRKRCHSSDDSSLLKVGVHDRESDRDPFCTRHADNETPQRDARWQLDPSGDDLPGQPPSILGSACFERRPRHKTRIGKYSTRNGKRKIDTLELKKTHHRSRTRRKDGKKRNIHSSKNVMKNFNSDAVLGGRVTMPQSLRPGLFENGRHANIKPLVDLSFSNTHFLRDRQQNQIPKQLFRRHLQELERQSKEIEELSAFFLPPEKTGPQHLTTIWSVDKEASRQASPRSCDQDIYEPTISYHNHSSVDSIPLGSYTNAYDKSVCSAQKTHDATKESNGISNTTAYFTWSRSPTQSSFEPDKQASVVSSCRSIRKDNTTSSIHKALIGTGIFKGTGIPGYDDELTKNFMQKRIARSHSAQVAPSVRLEDDMVSDHDVKPTHAAIPTENLAQSLLRRWRAIFPSEWQDSPQQRDQYAMSCDVDMGQLHKGDKQIGQAVNSTAEDSSVKSRDIMPPPPIPASHSAPPIKNAYRQPRLSPLANKHVPSNAEISAIHKLVAQIEIDGKTSTSASKNNCTSSISGKTATLTKGSVFPDIQSASCLPRPETPASTITTRNPHALRNSIWPLHANQVTAPRHSKEVSVVPPSGIIQAGGETMAEYIARIEHEARDNTLDQDMGEVSADAESPSWEVLGNTRPRAIYQEYTTIDSHDAVEQEEETHLGFRIRGGEWQHRAEYSELAGIEAAYGESVYVPKNLQEVGYSSSTNDVEQEKCEMSAFWRPNQILQF